MSALLAGYSSDEDGGIDVVKDAFSLNSLPVAKRPRVEETVAFTPTAAPHVLAEVCLIWLFFTICFDEYSY